MNNLGKREQNVISFDWEATNENKDIFPKKVAEFLQKMIDMPVFYKTEYMVPQDNWFKSETEFSENVKFAKTQFFVHITEYFGGAFIKSQIKEMMEQSKLFPEIKWYYLI